MNVLNANLLRALLMAAPVMASLGVVPAAGAAPTCHGLPVTTTVGAGEEAVGTSGDDVVSLSGAKSFHGLAGDDTICVDGGVADSELMVSGGTGDDYIDASAGSHGRTRALLDAGADTFLGSPYSDAVYTDPTASTPNLEHEVDVVRAGGGFDIVRAGNWGQRQVLDTVDLGADSGELQLLANPGPGARFEAAPMPDIAAANLFVLAGDGEWRVDLSQSTVTVNGGKPAVLRGFTNYHLTFSDQSSRPADISAVEFIGDGNGQTVSYLGPLTAQLGAGDDRVYTTVESVLGLDGGPGTDEITLAKRGASRGTRVLVDLSREVLASGGASERPAALAHFEDVTAYLRNVTVVGNAAPNHLVAGVGCGIRLEGRGGDDRLNSQSRTTCRDSTVLGGQGHDRMIGGSGRDLLVGGPGRDKAHGLTNIDRCLAEVRRDCE